MDDPKSKQQLLLEVEVARKKVCTGQPAIVNVDKICGNLDMREEMKEDEYRVAIQAQLDQVANLISKVKLRMDSSDEIGSDFIFELCGEVTRLPAI